MLTRPPAFADRAEAGRRLAQRLAPLAQEPGLLVLALPRGGVPIGVAVAQALGAPLALLLVRKIGVPGQPELAVAAVVDGTPPRTVVHEEVRLGCGVGMDYIDAQVPLALAEIERRRRVYGRARTAPAVAGRTVLVVDDGIATGTTLRAALQALRAQQPRRLVVAVPVAPADTLAALQGEADEFVCLAQPQPFDAVGRHYRAFPQLRDDEVVALLDAAATATQPRPRPPG